jgi:hypothetical protein
VLFTISVTANVALEQTIDLLAGQVDQLVSGQEFLNRVLTDRLDKVARPLAPASPPVEITPH